MKKKLANDQGYVLVVSLVLLMILTLLGIWGLQTSSLEQLISGNQQLHQQNFTVAEGGANREATLVGFGSRSAYNITNPNQFNQDLTTTNNATFSDPDSWPSDNLINGATAADTSYDYFVSYLYPDLPPPGYDASMFSAYKFRISGHHQAVVQLGGKKLGVKASM